MACGLLLTDLAPLRAQDGETQSEHMAVREIWSGAETFRSVRAVYTGMTYAPDGIMHPGLRLRLSTGMSTYSYTYSDASALQRARAAQPFADLLLGYQWQVGALTLKAFAGATGDADIRTAAQALDLWGQSRIGPKGTLEAWWRIDEKTWASADVAYASRQRTLWSRVRLGHRVWPQLSLGLEAGLAGDSAALGGRAGGFLRYEWDAGEVVLSGGIAGEGAGSAIAAPGADARAAAPYATLLWLQRF